VSASRIPLNLGGRWTGNYRLWVDPSGPVRESQSTATLSPVAGGNFTRLDYTWEYDGRPQDGSILIGFDAGRDIVTAIWVDSWHMSDKAMVSEGRATGGKVELSGTYAAPPGPDWGWRTVIEPADSDSLRMTMYNVSPEGKEDLAVEVLYRRAD
jgi:Protein of unknown function (DUF1579)